MNNFWKGSPTEHFYDISKSDQLFQRKRFFFRISSCPYSVRSPHSPEPCLWTDQNFTEQFLKRVTQGTFQWNYFKIKPAVTAEKIFKEFYRKFNYVAMATRVFDGIKFCEQFLKRTPPPRTFLPSLVQIGPAVGEEKMFNPSQTTNFRIFQSERVCRRLNLMKTAESSPKG